MVLSTSSKLLVQTGTSAHFRGWSISPASVWAASVCGRMPCMSRKRAKNTTNVVGTSTGHATANLRKV
eukprot:5007596-Pyramimonas_sp.AAC.1